MADDKEYTSQEVARHNTDADLWMTIHGHAYDLTKFLKEHPGGEEVLLNLAGQDGTACFDEIGHSQEAIQLRDNLRVGRVVGGPHAGQTPASYISAAPTADDDDDDWQYEETKKGSSTVPIFVAIGVVLYAVVFYYMFWSHE